MRIRTSDSDYEDGTKNLKSHFTEGSPPQPEPASSESAGRKLAFHEPRPCPTCQVGRNKSDTLVKD